MFVWWIFRGFVEAFIIFYIAEEVFMHSILSEQGQPGDLWAFSITIFTSLMFVVHNKLMIHQKKYDWLVLFMNAIASFGFYFFYLWWTDSMYTIVRQHFTFMMLFTSPVFYFTVGLCSSICFLIDFLLESYSQIMLTDARDLIRYQTLKNNAEMAPEFLEEFERLVNYQK